MNIYSFVFARLALFTIYHKFNFESNLVLTFILVRNQLNPLNSSVFQLSV